MRGFFTNGSFTEVTGCNVFTPEPQFVPIYSMRFDKRIPAQFCTFTVIRPSGILYPKGHSQVRNFFNFLDIKTWEKTKVRENW